MGGEPSSTRNYGNQNGSVHSLVSSVRGETDRNNPQRVFGPVVVLDGHGFRVEADRFQHLLQRVSQSCRAAGSDSNRNVGVHRRESQILSLAATLSWALS